MEIWNKIEYYDRKYNYGPSGALDIFVLLVTTCWAKEVCSPYYGGEVFIILTGSRTHSYMEDPHTAIALFLKDVSWVN